MRKTFSKEAIERIQFNSSRNMHENNVALHPPQLCQIRKDRKTADPRISRAARKEAFSNTAGRNKRPFWGQNCKYLWKVYMYPHSNFTSRNLFCKKKSCTLKGSELKYPQDSNSLPATVLINRYIKRGDSGRLVLAPRWGIKVRRTGKTENHILQSTQQRWEQAKVQA